MQVGQLGLNTYTGSGTTVLGLGTTLLSGSLPTELALLKDELRYLDLKHLHVEGTLPAGPFPELQVLHLEHARLSGVLSPTMVNGLPKIRSLRISASNISGTIPTELGRADLQVVPDCTSMRTSMRTAPPVVVTRTARCLRACLIPLRPSPTRARTIVARERHMHTEQVPNVTELHEITAELTRLSGTLPTQVLTLALTLTRTLTLTLTPTLTLTLHLTLPLTSSAPSRSSRASRSPRRG